MTNEKVQVKQIVAHIIIWACFAIFLTYPSIVLGRRIPTDIWSKLCLTISIFYLNYLVLVPQLLLRKKTLAYILISFLLLIGIAYVTEIYFKPDFPQKFERFPKMREMRSFRQPLLFIMVYGIPFAIGTALKVYEEWKRNDDLRQITENEKINSELQFLKTQLNPHFLFNSLNTIYSLSVQSSPDTPEAIMNISELMRYMLYEANRNRVPLIKEVNYLKNYVQLQRLRLPDGENVRLKISGDPQGKIIAPLLFIAFLENAFKYGTDFQGNTDIEINLTIKNESIKLMVRNSIGEHKGKEGSSGVGIKNVKNRLQLLYPDDHHLEIEDNGKFYTVQLNLKLN